MRSLIPLLLLVLLASCGEKIVEPAPIVLPQPGEAVVYSKHIAPIFQASCGSSGCHLDGARGGGVRLDSWVSTMAGSDSDGAMVIPYSVRMSHLFQHINSDTSLSPQATPRMPLSRDPLPDGQIDAIRRWIEEGARNDDGTIALTGLGRSRLFVANRTGPVLTALDCATRLVARYAPLGASPVGGGLLSMAASPDGRYVYLSIPGTGTVMRYDAGTFQASGSVTVGGSPGQLAITPDGGTIYVGNFEEDSRDMWIGRIDAAAMQALPPIADVGRAPFGVTLIPGTNNLATTNTLGDDIAIVDRTTGALIRRIPVSRDNPLTLGLFPRYRPYGAVVLRDGHTLVSSCRRNGEVRVFDLVAGQVVDSFFIGQQPGVPVLAPNGTEVWIPDAPTNSVTILDGTTAQVIVTLHDIDAQPSAIAFSPDGALAYVACQNAVPSMHHGKAQTIGAVCMIDVASRKVIRRIEIAPGAEGALVVP